MKKSKLFFCFLLITFLGYGQSVTIDSLKNELSKQGIDIRKQLDILKLLSKQDFPDGISQNIKFTEALLSLAKQNNNYKYASDALDFLISIHNQKGDFPRAADMAGEAIMLASENENTGDVVYFSNLCGTAHLNAGDYFDALENFKKAAQLASDNGWAITESSSLNNMGTIYYLLGDELTALDYFIQALNIKEKHQETKNLAGALINIGGLYNILGDPVEGLVFLDRAYENALKNKDVYSQSKALINMGEVNINLQAYEVARDKFRQALSLSDSIHDLQTKANILVKIGITESHLKNKEKALFFFQKSLNLSDSISYEYGISIASQRMGSYYLDEKKFRQALPYLQHASVVSKKINASANLLDNYKSLSNAYKQIGQPEQSLLYFTRFANLNDSLYNLDNHEKYSSVKTLYELDKKQRELDNLRLKNEITELEAKQSKYLLMGAIGLIAVIILVVILILRQHKVRSLQKTIRLEQKLLRSQINPHFIFNALTAVQRFIFEKSTLMASDYLGSFSRLIRFILNSSTVDQIALSEEIEFLKNYLELQAIRFDNKFDFEITVDKNIETESTFIPPMLVQPIVENAVEHGIRHLEKNGHIKIEYKKTNSLLNISIEDNGIGRKKSAEINARNTKKDKSLSTSITNERLLHLNKGLGENIKMKIGDLYNEQGEAKGTRVGLNIPMGIK